MKLSLFKKYIIHVSIVLYLFMCPLQVFSSEKNQKLYPELSMFIKKIKII